LYEGNFLKVSLSLSLFCPGFLQFNDKETANPLEIR